MFTINVFNNGDHACVAWRPEQNDPAGWSPVPDCRGFAVERRRTRGDATTQTWLRNRIGFAPHDPPPPAAEAWRWPIQRYLWWDYDVRPGDVVSYRVFPVKTSGGALQEPSDGVEGGWTEAQSIGSDFGDGISAWFNRGVIATQWVSRALAEIAKEGKPRTTLLAAVSERDNPLRERLGGLLKKAILDLLADPPGDVYAALYELSDVEVKDAFRKLGQRCSLILGNGAFHPPENDENETARAELRGVVRLYDRIVKSGHFAHNKFIVFCDPAGAPQSVFTGSTNLTMTGLCTQVNNGILIRDPAVAGDYLDAWTRLRDAGDAYPPALIDGNSAAAARVTGSTSITPWFAATRDAQDMIDARARIAAAREGILFLFFNPGKLAHEPLKETLLQTIAERKAANDLYVRGVVNQEIAGLTDGELKSPVALVQSGLDTAHLPSSVLVPKAIKDEYGDWQSELSGASSVMVHSKVIVIDPFGETPVVMTGSHNLGYKASSANDDNLAIISGNAKLAQAYAANIVAIFQEYRWRNYVANHRADGWKGLQDDDAWQKGHLEREAEELLFWVPSADRRIGA